jgi:PAS domain S-box-containing protein
VTDEPRPVRVLLVEDSADDAELVARTLRDEGLAFEPQVVATEAAFRAALPGFVPDLVLADWALPGFSGAAAVSLAHDWDPAVPCILVSGTLGEELVIEALRTGATDYVLKQRLPALVPAVRRALAEAAARREQARLEAELEASQAAMRAALDAMADPFLVCTALDDGDGRIIDFRVEFANRAAAVFMGGPAQLAGRTLLGGMGDAMGRRLFEIGDRVVRTGQPFVAESMSVPGARGAEPAATVLVDMTVAPLERGFFLVFRDVTERTRVARERERLAAVVEQSVDAITITDPAGQIVYANSAFVHEIGRGLPELLARSMPELMRSALDAATVERVDREVRAGRRWLGEVDQRLPDGTTRHAELSVTPGRDTDGVVASVVTVLRDVTQLREAQAELALQTRIREALAETLHAMPDNATLEQTAQAICDQLVTLPFVDIAAIDAYVGAGDVQVVAFSGPPGFPLEAGGLVPAERAASMRAHAAEGPWAEYTDSVPDADWIGPKVAAGLRAVAFGPIVRGGHAVGALVIGTFDERFARTLVETMPGLISFSATSSGLLAERLHALQREAELRGTLRAVLASRSFHPVFQPIVDLESGATVGYEALTRFESGQRPDQAFAEAWSVGLGAELELATLDAAVHEAAQLPQGRWLDLNVSPRLLADPGRLGELLWSAGRPLVLEITEHEAIADYDVVREAVRKLGHDIRLAVDDAGAGVANFGHIIELRPDFVKLDISLVRRVNANLGRQAMVVGMRHFSLTAGCRLVAEGVETDEEARTLAGLGVEFAQGYLFGRPAPVEAWAEQRSPRLASLPGS